MLARAWCHLCDEMLEALAPLAARHDVTVTVIDVDDPVHAALDTNWGDKVPVLFAGEPYLGNELCHYRLDVARVTAALESAE